MAQGGRTGGRYHLDVPLLPAPLIGRTAEIAAARELVRDGARLVTLTGPPGVGKTSLALALGAEQADRFDDGAAFVDLSAVADADQVGATIADTLGAGGRRRPVDRLMAMLRRRELLLILDNFEQVVAAGTVVSELLSACPRLVVIVTSRIPLRLRWEHELPVQPLRLPDPDGPRTAAAVLGVPAVRLFVERARAVSPAFAIGDENAAAVAEVCARLDGLPLAIELAAARVRMLTPATMLRQIARSGEQPDAGQPGTGGALGLLTGGARDLPARLQTLRDAIAWSHALLAPAEQRLFRRLAVFAGSCTIEAAERVCEATWAELGSLVEKSLLRQDGGLDQRAARDVEPRVRMLEMVREYALEQLAASGEEEAIRRRHLAYHVTLAEEAEPRLFGSDQAAWLDRLGLERDNLGAATRWAAQSADVESVVRLGGALMRFWRTRSDEAIARERVETLLALADLAPPIPATIKAFDGAGELAMLIGDYAAAQSSFEWSRDVALRMGDQLGAATALRQLCKLAGQRGAYAEAELFGDECLAMFEELGDLWGLASTLREVGMIVYFVGDLPRARQILERGLVTARQVGDQRVIANAAFSLALTLHAMGELDAAWPLYHECLATDRAQGHRTSEGSVLNNLGHIATVRGDRPAARMLLRDSLLASRDGGDRRRLAFTLSAVAGLLVEERAPDCAVRLDAAARAELDVIGARLEPPMRALYDQFLAPARNALGEGGVAAAQAAGRAMTLDRAVDEALAWLDHPVAAPGPELDGPAGTARSSTGPALTRREREVAALIAQGLTNRQIAKALVVSEGTAANHVFRLMGRLGLHNRAQVAAWAVKHRLHAEPSHPR